MRGGKAAGLLEIEEELYERYGIICGIDEAGRGPLAGPVYAAAVILPRGIEIEGLNDSKKLTERKRESIYTEMMERGIRYGIGKATAAEIDEINILEATYLAMNRAVEELEVQPGYAIVDGNMTRGIKLANSGVVKGDTRYKSIAAASVIAKVSRDRYMRELGERYPEYGFGRHKGYGTAEHREKIERYGIMEEHRRSFIKKLRVGE